MGKPTRIEHNHPVHKIGAHEPPYDGIHHVKRRRKRVVNPCGAWFLVAASTGEGPNILARARYLREYKKDDNRERAVRDHVTARDDDEERGRVVSDEEDVVWEENDVVQQIRYEVGGAVVEDGFLERGIGGREADVAFRENCGRAENGGRGAVEEGNQAAREFGSALGATVTENDEVADQVDCQEHEEEWEHYPSFREH